MVPSATAPEDPDVEGSAPPHREPRVTLRNVPGDRDAGAGGSLADRSRESSPPRSPLAARALTVEAGELVSCNRATSPVLCETAIFDPDPTEELLGSLYVVVETINLSEKASGVLEAATTAIRKEYYREPQRDMLASFESALDQANHVLGDLAEQGESDWVDNFHASVCVFRGQTLHISRAGKAELLLARKQRFTDIGEGVSDPRARRPLHPFTSVASGTVAEADTLLLSTPQLFHLLPRDRLQQLTTEKSPAQTVALLRSLLEDSREDAAFATLILRFVKAPERLPAPEVPVELPRRATITPTPPPPLRPQIRPRRPIETKSSLGKQALRVTKRGATLLWQGMRTRVLPMVAVGARWSAQRGGTVARSTSRSVHRAWRRWQAHGEGQPPSLPPATAFGPEGSFAASRRFAERLALGRETAKTLPERSRTLMRSLPQSAKIFLGITVILAILFAGSLVALSRKRQEDAAVRAALERLQEARVKKEGADAALIYDNTEQARQLLREARTAAEDVAKTAYYKDEIGTLLTAIQDVEDRVERVTRVSDPQVVGDFGSVSPSLNTPAMAVIGSAMYTFDPTNNAIFRLNTESGETSVVSQTSQGIGYFRSATALPAEKAILFSTDSPGLALFDAERGDLIKQEITLPEGVTEIRALGTFGSRLYILAPQQKMIYGYSKTLAGYEGGTPWLRDANVPADRAVALGIDGYIYLLTDDGKIIKLLKGSPVEFKQAELTTPLRHPTRLIITEQLKHLYVLDPENTRALIYDTTGGLTRQLVFPNAKALKDIAVTAKEDLLYVLDGTQVSKVSLK